MLRAYADDADAACAAPHATHGAARDDYIARALSRFRNQLDRTCLERSLARTRDVYDALVDYFNHNVAWQWPYSGDRNASEVPGSTLSEFVARLHAAEGERTRVEGGFAELFRDSARFWSRDDDGGVAVRFRVDWRSRPTQEQLAEHVIEFGFDGIEQDEGGVHSWRYGTPAALKLRLAKNSPYRFVGTADPAGRQIVFDERGNGALLRILEWLYDGTLTIETEVVDERGGRQPLRITARITHPDGVPMTVPRFHEYPRHGVAGEARFDPVIAGE